MINSGVQIKARPLTKIIGGILTSTNTFSRDNNNTIEAHLRRHSGFKGIDIGCIADYGSFFVDYEGEESTKEEDFDKRYQEYYIRRTFKELKFSKSENSFVTFYMQLTRYLQQAIGTVPAINLQAYLDKIGEEIDEEL